MQIKIFEIPAFDTTGLNEEMNKFLRSHKVLKIEQQLVQSGDTSYWSFCIKYMEGKPTYEYAKRDRIPCFHINR